MKSYSDKDKEKLQDNLSLLRKLAGWTSAELGEYLGITKQTVSNLENKHNNMTKAQYIAIRTLLDYEIKTNPDNTALAQVVAILLDADDLTEEEQEKVDTAVTYVTGAKAKGMDDAAISTGLAALIAALGIGALCLPGTGMIPITVADTLMKPLAEAIVSSDWLKAIKSAGKLKKN